SHIALSGFIDAASYPAFEKTLEEVFARGGRFAVADFSGLSFINSTGISAVIRFFGQYGERGGLFCLAAVPRPVGLSMHLLGVTSLIPFLKDVEAARQHLLDFLEGRLPPAGPAEGAAVEGPVEAPRERQRVPLRKGRSDLSDARVLLLHPSKNRFSRILRLRFQRLNGRFHLIHDIKEALERYEELNPDLVVVDSRLDPKGEFVTRVKINKARSLTSVIKIYEKETDVESHVDFKIWENDYLVDPFEALELFSLAETELLRVPRDRKLFQQQVRFEFRFSPENIEKANKLSDLIIRQSIPNEEDQTALFAAVKEAIDNGIVHGNRRSSGPTIDVNFLVDQSKVTVMVEDGGKGFDFEYYLSRIDSREAFEKAKRRILSGGQRGGLGILLMHKCCDRLEYSGAGNIVRLEKNLAR
ncbi:MAG: ATP-binding protein, partial [Thermoanaerobaculia bacterium]